MPGDDIEQFVGGVNTVVRVGDRVHRPRHPSSATIGALFDHLHAERFHGCPRLLGFDEANNEILTFLPGDVGNYPLSLAVQSDRALRTAARLLRSYHDAASSYVDRIGTLPLPPLTPAETVLHGDFAPYNCVFDHDKAVAMIDFDAARVGPRLWDVAYAAYRFCPITAATNPERFGPADEQSARLAVFVQEYDHPTVSAETVLSLLPDRLEQLVRFMYDAAANGNEAFQTHIARGDAHLYLTDAAHARLLLGA